MGGRYFRAVSLPRRMSAQDTFDEIALLVQARYALIMIDTREAERASAGLARIASDLNLPFITWSRSRGMRRGELPADPVVEQTEDPARGLSRILAEGAGIYHSRDLGAHLDDPNVVSHVIDVVHHFASRRGVLVVTGQDIRVPEA